MFVLIYTPTGQVCDLIDAKARTVVAYETEADAHEYNGHSRFAANYHVAPMPEGYSAGEVYRAPATFHNDPAPSSIAMRATERGRDASLVAMVLGDRRDAYLMAKRLAQKCIDAGNGWTVHIWKDRTRGHVECNGEAIIGLWFEGEGTPFEDHTLVDYDGQFSLPRRICETLRDAGVKVSEDFWP